MSTETVSWQEQLAHDPWFPWSFFALIYALSVPFWVLDAEVGVQLLPGLPISSLMILSTLVAACWFAYRRGRWHAVYTLLARSVDVRRVPSPRWYLPSFLLMPAILAVSYGFMRLMGMQLPAPQITWSSAPALLVMFLVAAACEELAWSATALEPVQLRWGRLRAALLIGAVWSVWHAVPFMQSGHASAWIIGQMLFLVVFRGVLVWLYDNAGKATATAIICHASYNVAWQLFPNSGSGYNPWVATVFTIGTLAALVLWTRLPGGSRQSSR